MAILDDRTGLAIFLSSLQCVYRTNTVYKLSFAVVLLLPVLLFPLVTSAAGNSVPVLLAQPSVASAGFYQLNWAGDADQFELQQSETPDFSESITLYLGKDNASLQSGLANGERFYRVRTINDNLPGQWSEVVKVTVEHHSLQKALFFLLLGLSVFVSTALLVIRGEKE